MDEKPLAPVREYPQTRGVPGHEEKKLCTEGLGGSRGERSKVIDVGRTSHADGSPHRDNNGVICD